MFSLLSLVYFDFSKFVNTVHFHITVIHCRRLP